MSRQEEVILYLETADGDVMAVPESKLEEFRILNEEIKAEMLQKEKATQKNSSAEGRPKR
jgi:hypothetical protein